MTRARHDRILKRLEEDEVREGSLPPILQFYRRLLAVQHEAGERLGAPAIRLSAPEIKERVRQGKPLIDFDDLDLDWAVFVETFNRVAALFADYPELFIQMPPNPGGRTLTREAVKAAFSPYPAHQ